MTRVRIRGIYATALTRALRDVATVVQASPPIRQRFARDFPVAVADATIDPTADRQGVGIVGDPAAVDRLRDRLVAVGVDAFGWTDPTPRSAVFDAAVVETLGRGAVVDLGPREGFLPYDAADGYVDEGDELRVQVHDPTPPWGDRRPAVGATLRAPGRLAGLVRGVEGPTAAVADEERARELVRTTDILPTDVPEGWAVRWGRAAADADVNALDDALAHAAARAEMVEAALDGDGDADHPEATAWVWFGRECRFALDERRREVVPTMRGHHRIKAGTEAASVAVDFAERVCAPDDAFPFDAVADLFGPREGDRVRIDHGKPDGRRFPLGRGEVTTRDGDTVTVRRSMTPGGTYDALDVPREAGDVAVTTLKEGRWWYPTIYRSAEDEVKGTYVNVCTPVELFPAAATYVDLEVDVVRYADGRVERVDDDDLDAAVDAGHVSDSLAEKARAVASAVERAFEKR